MTPILDKSKIPHRPGVYIFKDQAGKILYVGKAVDLYHRVASYFSGASPDGVNLTHPRGGLASHLISQISNVETIVVESELEALILEANLIKKYLPPFNVRLTDNKDYLYILLTKEDCPKVLTARKKDLVRAKKYWGPFPSSRTVRETLKSLRKVFPWCSASNLHSWSGGSKYRIVNRIPIRDRKYRRPCFYYHLGLCPGACVGLIPQKDYKKIFDRFSKLLDGKKEKLVVQLTSEMANYAKQQRFEEAAKIKKMLEGISYLTQPNRTRLYLENPNFLQKENQLALEQLKKDLNLNKLPERIEGYDISNIQGKEAAGSMVVLTSGEIDKSQYRKFKIHISGKPNDVGMMREMIRRRLKHREWPLPDLILVDGGRGQARAVKFEIRNSKFEIPLFGLAKKMEWLYPPEGEIIKLSKKSLSLKLLQKLRDEAHRFAASYHRKLHGKMLLGIPSTSSGNIR